jgi:hypothetical protein
MKTGTFDINSTNFLGGHNVQFLVLATAVGFLAYKAWKK